MEIIKFENPVPIDKVGDILEPFTDWDDKNTSTGSGYFSKVEPDMFVKHSPLPIPVGSRGNWDTLHDLGVVNAKDIKEKLTAECPWSDNKYFIFYPIAILFQDKNTWDSKQNDKYFGPYRDMFFDRDWQMRRFEIKDREVHFSIGSVDRSLLGHGYTEGTMPSDGGGGLKNAAMHLSNGDLIIGKVWVWYNK